MKKILVSIFTVLILMSGVLVACGEKEIAHPNIIQDKISISINQSTTLEAENADGASWKSSNDAIVTVADGVIKGIKEGVATVSLTLGEQKDEIIVTVVKPSIELDLTANTVVVGSEFTLAPTIVPNDSVISWSSSDEKTATVNNGKVTTLKAGTTTITAKITVFEKEYVATCDVTVTNLIYTPVLNETVFDTEYFEGNEAIDLSYTNTDTKIKNFNYQVVAKKLALDKEIDVPLVDNKLSALKGGKYKINYSFSGDNMIDEGAERFIIINEVNDYGVLSTLSGGNFDNIIKKNWFSTISYDEGKQAIKLVQRPEDWEPASVSFDIYKLLATNVSSVKIDVFFETTKSGLTQFKIAYGLNKLDPTSGELTKNYTFTKKAVDVNKWVTIELPISEIKAKMEAGINYDCVRIALTNCLKDENQDDIAGVLYMKNIGFGYGDVSVIKGEHPVSDFPTLYNGGDSQFTSTLAGIFDGDTNLLADGKANLTPKDYIIKYTVSGKTVKNGEYQIALKVNDFRAKYNYGTINAFNDELSISNGVHALNSSLSVAGIGTRNALKVTKTSGNYGVTLDDFDILSFRHKIKSISYDIYSTTAVNVENGWSDNKDWNVINQKWAVTANEWNTINISLDSLYGVKFGGWKDNQTENTRLKDLQIRFVGDDANVTEFYLSNFVVNFDYIGAVNSTDLSLPSLGMKNFSYAITDVLNSENASVLDKVNTETKILSGIPTGVYTVKYAIEGDDILTKEFSTTIKVGSSNEGKFMNFNDQFAADRVVRVEHESNDLNNISVETWGGTYPGNTNFSKLKITNKKGWDGTNALGCAVGIPYGKLLDRDFEYNKLTIKLFVSTNDASKIEARIGFYKDYSANYVGAIYKEVAINTWTTIEVTKAELQGLGTEVYCYDSLRLHFKDTVGYNPEFYIADISIL